MSRPVVFDLDGVLFDFMLHFTKFAHSHFPSVVPFPNSQQVTWSFQEHQVLTREEESYLWGLIKESSDFWVGMPLLVTTGDVYAMNLLAQTHPIVYLTARNGKDIGFQSKFAMQRNGLPQGQLLFSSDKAEAISKFEDGCAAAIDDRPEQLEELKAAGVRVYARDWYYNRHVDVPRVSSVGEFCIEAARG